MPQTGRSLPAPRATGKAGTTREQDIETARRYYAELLAFEVRIEAAGDQMYNRGRWLEAEHHLREARESLELFIGERMTADLRQDAYERQPSLFSDAATGRDAAPDDPTPDDPACDRDDRGRERSTR